MRRRSGEKPNLTTTSTISHEYGDLSSDAPLLPGLIGGIKPATFHAGIDKLPAPLQKSMPVPMLTASNFNYQEHPAENSP